MARILAPKKNKSAHRVLEVLEYFNSHSEETTVMGVARAMNYPQSSTSELLQCLVALGYLHQNRYARTYRLSARVALLGVSVAPKLFRHGALMSMIDELAEESQATIVLGIKVGVNVKYIHVVAAADSGSSAPIEGATASLIHSAIGKLLLTGFDRAHLRMLVQRLNAEIEDSSLRVSSDNFLTELDKIRARGYAVNYNETGAGDALIGLLLPRFNSVANVEDQIALGILTPKAVMETQEESFLNMLRGAVARHLGSFPSVARHGQPCLTPKHTALLNRH